MPTLQSKFRPRRIALSLVAFALAQLSTPAAAGIEVQVHGIEEPMLANVLAYLSFERYQNSNPLSREFIERLQERTEREVRLAMRPFGYYEPVVTSRVDPLGGEQNYRVTVNVTPGMPVTINKVDVKVTGPGATDKRFTDITGDLPVRANQRLNHAQYEELKGKLLRTAATFGYL